MFIRQVFIDIFGGWGHEKNGVIERFFLQFLNTGFCEALSLRLQMLSESRDGALWVLASNRWMI